MNNLSVLIAKLQSECEKQSKEFNLCRKKQCIHQVPSLIKSVLDPVDAYRPRAFTFGPAFFRSSYDQSHKYRALHVFLGEKQQLHWQHLLLVHLSSIWGQVEEAYDPLLLSHWRIQESDYPDFFQHTTGTFFCPSGPIDRKSDELMIIMLLDAAFMIEVMLAASTDAIPDGYSESDPIFSRHGFSRAFPTMKRDMLLLENQLPLLVLNQLLGVKTGKYDNEEYMNKLILSFYDIKGPPPPSGLGCHVLDVVHKSLLLRHPDQGIRSMTRSMTAPVAIVRPVRELLKAGITFGKSKTHYLDDITLVGYQLCLPVLEVHHHTESMFLNLMAYERLDGKTGEGGGVCSYVAFMSSLIVSERDAYALHLHGIVKNCMGGEDAAVVEMFRRLSRGVQIGIDSSLPDLCGEINRCCEGRWREVFGPSTTTASQGRPGTI